jgi:predicted ester cyclase
MSEQNKALARRFYEEVFNQKKLTTIDELCDPAFIDHNAMPGQRPGAEGLKDMFGHMLAGLPDLRITIHELVAERDIIVARFTIEGTHKGTFLEAAPTGKRVTLRGMDMVRLRDGRAVEAWHEGNDAEVLMSLGVQPQNIS